jgi:two-component system, cell cycle sensor histidine kinase PleC
MGRGRKVRREENIGIPMPSEKPRDGRRRVAAQRVREARDRLNSSTGIKVAFDYELLRQYAENRLSAALAIVLLIGSVGFLSSIWDGVAFAGIWTAVTLACHGIIVMHCRRFLSVQRTAHDLKRWRLRFIILELAYGLAWMFNLIHPIADETSLHLFILFVMLLFLAVSSMLASSLPIAVFAASLPVTSAVALTFVLLGSLQNAVLATMVIAAQGYFALLTFRLYSAGLATLVARAEKETLIVELEQAKLNSDDARHRAEGANIAKSQFLAQMSHELRTPLNAILGFSEVMKSEVFGPHHVAAYKEYSADIHTSGQHLLNLINEILDLSRIEAGRYELHEEPVSLTAVADDCHHLLKLRAAKKSITIHNVFEPDLPRLWADDRALRQICLNLLSNGVKFTPQGGEIWLKVGWTASGGQYLSVKDTGPGIPEEEIPIVLSKFGQGSNAIKSAEQGTGLGLPIAKNLVDMHGGTFTLKSKVRIGTELIATFPPERVMMALAPILEDPADPLQEPSKPQKNKRSAQRQSA